MPVDVGKGTTQIVLSNGDAGTFVNETNGPAGVIYANVNIPRHFAVNSRHQHGRLFLLILKWHWYYSLYSIKYYFI